MQTILVTGATGFIGSRFMAINEKKYNLIPVSLRNTKVEELSLENIDGIVFLAGIAHQRELKNEALYYTVNRDFPVSLAVKAKASKVRNFIYISSVKVYGDHDFEENELNENSACSPTDVYGKSKLEAELALLDLGAEEYNIHIIRPPLVYGPNVKGNMLALLDLLDSGKPIPFNKINNRRSMVFVDNLIALINRLIDVSQPSGVHIAGDESPISTTELVQYLKHSIGSKSRIVSMPSLVRLILKKIKPGLYQRLFGSFVIDNTSTNRKLKYIPLHSTEAGIMEMGKWYTEKQMA